MSMRSRRSLVQGIFSEIRDAILFKIVEMLESFNDHLNSLERKSVQHKMVNDQIIGKGSSINDESTIPQGAPMLKKLPLRKIIKICPR